MDKELCERAREVIEQRLRPREDVIAVRRHLTHDLAQSLGVEQLSSPLSLIDLDTVVTPSDALQGTYREYVEAVKRNVEIRTEFVKLQEEHDAATASLPTSSEEDQQVRLLELQLEVNALEQEHERLNVVDKYLEELDRQPAAAPDFLDHKTMFKDCAPIPELPQELMASFTEDRDAPNRDIQELLSRLQKAVLRNKLLAQREKQNFEKLKAKNPIDPGSLSPQAQLQALNAVKDSLINWIETMLTKAGGDEDGSSLESPSKPRQTEQGKYDREAHMAEIQREYEHHIKLRKEIMALIGQLKQLKVEPPQSRGRDQVQPSETFLPRGHKTDSEAFLLTPYLEKLQAISREQKGLIQEKSHINTALAKQKQDLNKILDHLVEESHLLPKYPAKKPDGNQLSFGEATRRSNVTSQIEPWISAAESAQIATLEAVFEKIEEGQIAVEDAMQALDQARKLLNKEEPEPEETPEGQDTTEQDMWIGEGDSGGARVRKNREKKVEKQKGESIYAKLDGNLGLINE
ncbi:hypothetical protein F4820DRAFT_426075 [Hypoxylon rubiginosum]|uniref:Uncharacterized protein n=1 Tax=Hypoxylon rubiginosum TaxID=110542 RepID=A0ACB9YWK8_9PEZI|nr:hypothetical protein F4820DRAFT_426075 [Hypoxylon rubiginosum]